GRASQLLLDPHDAAVLGRGEGFQERETGVYTQASSDQRVALRQHQTRGHDLTPAPDHGRPRPPCSLVPLVTGVDQGYPGAGVYEERRRDLPLWRLRSSARYSSCRSARSSGVSRLETVPTSASKALWKDRAPWAP